MNHKAKSRVGLAKDGKTLVDADSPESATLFAGVGALKTEAELEGKENVAKFFAKEGAAKEDVKTHEAAPAPTRVVSSPQTPKASAPHVKGK